MKHGHASRMHAAGDQPLTLPDIDQLGMRTTLLQSSVTVLVVCVRCLVVLFVLLCRYLSTPTQSQRVAAAHRLWPRYSSRGCGP